MTYTLRDEVTDIVSKYYHDDLSRNSAVDRILAIFAEERAALMRERDRYAEVTANVKREFVKCVERAEAVEAREAKLREALGQCRELFSSIRGDWSDPRTECREGWRIIDAALASVKEEKSNYDPDSHIVHDDPKDSDDGR